MSRRLSALLGFLLALSASLPAQGFRDRAKPAAEADSVNQDRAALTLRMTRAEFAAHIRRQSSMHIAPSGEPLYICRKPSAAPVGTDTTTYVAGTDLPLDQTFALHSRPGAARVIYLDFTGHVTTGTGWNSPDLPEIITPPFDLDGDPDSFSADEHAAMQRIWRQVAEDFAPFNVDVTTEDPGEGELSYSGPGDNLWGTRVAIGGSSNDWFGGGAGGVAFLNSFVRPNGTPCFVFPDDLGGANSIAYAASHEVGHTFGLRHDGIDGGDEYYGGHGKWAPIMGAGYGATVIQWSKGDYANASNLEDDVAIIAETAPYAPSDIAPNAQAAPVLAPGDFAGGTIARDTDNAWYRFEAGDGPVDFIGSIATPIPTANLKLKLSLVNGQGDVVAETAVGVTQATRLRTTVTAGTYFLVVDGIGEGDPSTSYNDYGSLGRFRVSGTWSLPPANKPPLASTAGSTPLVGGRPLTVNLTGTNSVDVDGAIVGYEWDFGDGSPRSFLPSPSHTYANPGTYPVSLTVTDDDGAVDSATVNVVVSPRTVANRTLRVLTMTPSWVSLSRTAGQAQCLVRVVDSAGRPLPGVSVTATLAGLDQSVVTVVTDRAGVASLRSASIPSAARGSVTFTVRDATLNGFTYLPTLNRVTSSSVRR